MHNEPQLFESSRTIKYLYVDNFFQNDDEGWKEAGRGSRFAKQTKKRYSKHQFLN